MTPSEAYADQLAALRSLLSHPGHGIHLLEFATIPQLEGIIADLRPICAERSCIELIYDPARENPALLIDRARHEIQNHPQAVTPLLILHPAALPDATHDGPAANAFWKALNFRREAFGALPAQILLCVDPWHYGHLVDEALDLLSWVMPRFHLIPPPNAMPAKAEMLKGVIFQAKLDITPEAARARWDTFWPILEELRHSGPLQSSAIRRYILPLLESALASGNLINARQVRDTVGNTLVPPEDLVSWHRLNAILACGAGDYSQAEDHAERLRLMMQEPYADNLRIEAARSLRKIANLLLDSGQVWTSGDLHRNLVTFGEQYFGLEHYNTLSSRMDLANSFRGQGRLIDAEQEYRAVLAIRDRLMGSEDPATLTSRGGVATALSSQGKHAEAEHEYRAIMEIQERVLGAEHPATMTSQNNLANALNAQGKFSEAEQVYRAVLAKRQRLLGAEHPSTLLVRANLANALNDQGKHVVAEQENRNVLSVMERVLGAEHPRVFQGYFNLAVCIYNQGNYKEAVDVARRALVGFNRVLGEDHPNSRNAKAFVMNVEKL